MWRGVDASADVAVLGVKEAEQGRAGRAAGYAGEPNCTPVAQASSVRRLDFPVTLHPRLIHMDGNSVTLKQPRSTAVAVPAAAQPADNSVVEDELGTLGDLF